MYDFTSFYEAHVDKIYNYCFYRVKNRQAAEDITSEAFTRLVDKGYEDLENPRAYLYTTCRNLIVDQYRAEGKTVSANWLVDSKDEPGYEVDNENKLMASQIIESMDELPDDQRDVLLLQYVQDLDNRAICEILGKTESSVKSLAHRGLETLRARFNQI